MEKRKIAWGKIIAITFILIGLLNLLHFITFINSLAIKDCATFSLFIIYATLGLLIWFKWDKMANWLKWAFVFIYIQLLLIFILMKLIFLPSLDASFIILFKLMKAISYPSYLYNDIVQSKRVIMGENMVQISFYRWESLLKIVLDRIYAGLIGILSWKLFGIFKSSRLPHSRRSEAKS